MASAKAASLATTGSLIACVELHIVDGSQIGWVAHRDNEDRSRSIDRQDLMFLRQLPRDQLDDGFIDFKLIQVNGRHPIVLLMNLVRSFSPTMPSLVRG